MRPIILRIGLLLMGIGLLGGSVGTELIDSFKAIDEQVGTNGSAAAAVLGIGLIVAAFSPSGALGWVRAGILYGVIVLVFEVVSAVHGKGFHLGPVIFGLAFTLLLIAAYPERKKLLPSSSSTPPPDEKPGTAPAEEETHPEPQP